MLEQKHGGTQNDHRKLLFHSSLTYGAPSEFLHRAHNDHGEKVYTLADRLFGVY
ncbi:MAG: hypothetical protein IPM91_07310 [Bacteroidetes bacterium]|nr:hypothetical protein [Bacteroidota bacterium]